MKSRFRKKKGGGGGDDNNINYVWLLINPLTFSISLFCVQPACMYVLTDVIDVGCFLRTNLAVELLAVCTEEH